MGMVVMTFDVVIGMVAMICEVMKVMSMSLKLRRYDWHADNDDLMMLMFMRGDADYDDGDADVICSCQRSRGTRLAEVRCASED